MTSSIDRLTIIALLATASLPFAAFSPAQAATSQSCAEQAQQVRTLAETADPKDAAKALRTASVAERICAEGGRLEAGKKFTLALKQLDVSVQMADKR